MDWGISKPASFHKDNNPYGIATWRLHLQGNGNGTVTLYLPEPLCAIKVFADDLCLGQTGDVSPENYVPLIGNPDSISHLAFALRICYPFFRMIDVSLVRSLYAIEDATSLAGIYFTLRIILLLFLPDSFWRMKAMLRTLSLCALCMVIAFAILMVQRNAAILEENRTLNMHLQEEVREKTQHYRNFSKKEAN